jgi:hypothetical protein
MYTNVDHGLHRAPTILPCGIHLQKADLILPTEFATAAGRQDAWTKDCVHIGILLGNYDRTQPVSDLSGREFTQSQLQAEENIAYIDGENLIIYLRMWRTFFEVSYGRSMRDCRQPRLQSLLCTHAVHRQELYVCRAIHIPAFNVGNKSVC